MAKKQELEGFEDLSNLSPREIEQIRKIRWKCRTDIRYLITQVLGPEGLYNPEVHDPMLDSLQKFPEPTEEQMLAHDKFENGRFYYKPIVKDLLDLPGERDRLLLSYRGIGKTTFNCSAHTIQWIINYPGISICIMQFSLEKAEGILAMIKGHFTQNPKFRTLFPELCPPPEKIHDFGKVSSFSVPNSERGNVGVRKEETVMAGSIDSGMAGYHFEVIKYSDIVEPKNTENVDQCEKLISTFSKSKYLRCDPRSWRDVEGTRYSFADLYGKIINNWYRDIAAGTKPEFQCFIQGVLKRDIKNPKYTPDELTAPYLLDESGKRVSVWPRKWTIHDLERDELENPYDFSCQMLNHPIPGGSVVFPEPSKKIHTIPRAEFERDVNIAFTTLTIDTATSVAENAKYTAMVYSVVDRFGRVYVADIRHGRWLPDDLVVQVVAACSVFRPDYLLMEKVPFVLGFEPSLKRQWALNPHYYQPVIHLTPRDSTDNKLLRIQNTLQTPYKTGDLKFVRENISPEIWNHLIREFTEFPQCPTNDILDALADSYQARQWFGPNYDRDRKVPNDPDKLFSQWARIEPPDYTQMGGSSSTILKPSDVNSYWGR